MGKPSFDLPRIFGIHLFLLELAYFGFGTFHVMGLYGPEIWVLEYRFSILGLYFSYKVISHVCL